MLLQVLFVTLVSVSSSSAHDIQSEIPNLTVERRLHLKKNERFRMSEMVNNEGDSLHTAVCSYKNKTPPYLCNVTAETFGYRATCKNIKLQPTDKIDIYPVNVHRMIIKTSEWTQSGTDINHYSDSGKKIYNIIDLRNCRVTRVTRPMNISWSPIIISPIVYSDSFDIVIEDKSKCLGTDSCRETYNYEGEWISSAKPLLQQFSGNTTIKPRANLSPDKGHYLYTIVPTHIMYIQYVSPIGDAIELIYVTRLSKSHIVESSNAYEKFGICWIAEWSEKLNNPKINCVQFNDAKLEVNVTFNLSGLVDWLAVHNLVDGGMLVVSGNCEKKTDGHGNCQKFQLQRIYADGRIGEPLHADDLNLDPYYSLKVNIAERDGNKFCIFFSSVINEEAGQAPHTRPTQNMVAKYHRRCIWKQQIF